MPLPEPTKSIADKKPSSLKLFAKGTKQKRRKKAKKKKKRRFGGRRDEVRGPVQLASRLTPRQQQYDVRPDEEKGGPDRFVFRFLFFASLFRLLSPRGAAGVLLI